MRDQKYLLFNKNFIPDNTAPLKIFPNSGVKENSALNSPPDALSAKAIFQLLAAMASLHWIIISDVITLNI
ncbi:hypothetical protein RT99_00110 [Flavobacterium sp. MEB061]|nr:hypothetical protein RT99_00110 [Flavobacterium sp. MEB061]